MKFNLTNITFAFCSLFIFTLAQAQWQPSSENEKKGLELSTLSKEKNRDWINSTNDLEMILINNKGDKSSRKIRSRNLEVQGDGDKALSIFDSPKDVKGTAFLTFSHIEKTDDQWIYLPALKRVKRISSKNRSGPFMGSEFAYEDLSSFEIQKYAYEFIAEEQIDGQKAYKVKYIPFDKYSGYKYFFSWLSAEHYQPLKSEFYDRKSALLKTLTFKGYKKYGKVWRVQEMKMNNHQKKRITFLYFKNYQFNTSLTENDFNKRKLKSIR